MTSRTSSSADSPGDVNAPPCGGWVGGGYDRRWNATMAQARRTIALGGKFVLLDHDLWGADGAAISRYIARLERAGADGLRANWAGGSNLHNDLAAS